MHAGNIKLPLELRGLTDDDYKELWRQCGPIKVEMIEKCGQCVHNLRDTFYYETPYKKPQGICTALLHVLDLYAWRVALGFPSWQGRDRSAYQIHCPDRTGTVWEMRKVKSEQSNCEGR